MGLFDFLKKKKEDLPLPPPPSAPQRPEYASDIEPIRATESIAPPEFEPEPYEMPPALPAPKTLPQELPELPEFQTPRTFQPARETYTTDIQEPAQEKEVIYDKTIEEKETVRPTPKPTFVAVEDYKRIINDTNTVRAKLLDAETFVRRLGDLKNEEEKAIERWQTHLEQIEKKLSYVDKLIAKAQR